MQYSGRKVHQFTPKSQKSIKTQFSQTSVKYSENTPSPHTQPLSSHGPHWKFLENRRQNQLNTLFNIRKKRLACITNINRKIYQKIATQQSHYSYKKIVGCQNQQFVIKNSKVSNFFQGKNPESNSRTLIEIIANNLQKKHIFGHVANISTNNFDFAKQQFLLRMDGLPQRAKSLQQTIMHKRQLHQVGNIIRIGKLKGSILKENGLSTRTMQFPDKDPVQRLFKTAQLKKRYKSAQKIDLPDIFTNFN